MATGLRGRPQAPVVAGSRGYLEGMTLALLGLVALGSPPDSHREVRGVTVSTPTWGHEWGSDAMVGTLEALAADGVNWIAIHPYARVDGAGHVEWRLRPDEPTPEWLSRPIREAHARGIKVLVVPHLAYWGQFSWRGDVQFEDPGARARFFEDYRAWISDVARRVPDADAFAVGSELDATIAHEAEWRRVIADVRSATPATLTYASNWDRYEQVPFWDALDVIGVQAYFPLVDPAAWPPGTVPPDDVLAAGWRPVFERVSALSARTGKPVVFTELGYDANPSALVEPWASGRGGEAVQEAALRVALAELARSEVRGAFLWKWFPGELPRGDFRLTRPEIRAILRDAWRPAVTAVAGSVDPIDAPPTVLELVRNVRGN